MHLVDRRLREPFGGGVFVAAVMFLLGGELVDGLLGGILTTLAVWVVRNWMPDGTAEAWVMAASVYWLWRLA